jgi:hypothetical protein
VSLVDHGQVLRLGVGERFVLDQDLTGMRQVIVSLSDLSVLRLLGEGDEGRPQVYDAGGNMQVHHEYQAVRPGRTTLQVDAVARREMRAPSFNFLLDIEVR